jgi:lysophospholipase L1-like esterase
MGGQSITTDFGLGECQMPTVMCFGDSNTHGTMPIASLDGRGRFARADRWTTHFAAALPGWEVIAEGQPGRTTVHDDPIEGAHRNGLAVLPALLESHAPIDVVIIMLGTNDLKARFAVTPFDIAASLERLVRVVGQSGAGPGGAAPRVLLVVPPPIVETGCLAGMFAGGAVKSGAMQAEIAQAGARAEVPVFHAGPHLVVSALDGIHYDATMLAPFGLALAQAFRHHFGD